MSRGFRKREDRGDENLEGGEAQHLTPVLEKEGRVKKKVPGPSDPGGSANMVESLDLETREEVLGPHLRCEAPDAPCPQSSLHQATQLRILAAVHTNCTR